MFFNRNVAISGLQGAALGASIGFGMGAVLSSIGCMGGGVVIGMQAESSRNYTDYNKYFSLEGYGFCSLTGTMLYTALGVIVGAAMEIIKSHAR